MTAMKIVIALGGNALLKRSEPLTLAAQKANIDKACGMIAEIARQHQVILTHGNGPQVGLLALKQPDFSFDVLGAESEGMIGYMLAQQLMNELPKQPIATLLTQVEVNANDPAFQKPVKFIGPVYTQTESLQLKTLHPEWNMAMDGASYRRVIASPEPQKILEISTIELLMKSGVLVICCGGGGIPVINRGGFYHGVEAVIDKDLAAAKLAQQLQADCLLMLTDVKAVMKNWGTPQSEPIAQMSIDDMNNQFFAPGSMGPKVMAAARFVKATGKTAYIGALEDTSSILQNRAGTLIHS
jgi:carbamate kinase